MAASETTQRVAMRRFGSPLMMAASIASCSGWVQIVQTRGIPGILRSGTDDATRLPPRAKTPQFELTQSVRDVDPEEWGGVVIGWLGWSGFWHVIDSACDDLHSLRPGEPRGRAVLQLMRITADSPAGAGSRGQEGGNRALL